MKKTLEGTVVSTKMEKTVVVIVVSTKPHPLYGKLVKVSKRYKADTNGKTVQLGDVVKISQTKPLSKDKHFIVTEITKTEVQK